MDLAPQSGIPLPTKAYAPHCQKDDIASFPTSPPPFAKQNPRLGFPREEVWLRGSLDLLLQHSLGIPGRKYFQALLRTQTLRRSCLTSSRPASRPWTPSSSPSRGRWVRGAQAETGATVGCDAWNGPSRAGWHRRQRKTCGARPGVMAARATAALLHAAARSRDILVCTLADPPPRATAALLHATPRSPAVPAGTPPDPPQLGGATRSETTEAVPARPAQRAAGPARAGAHAAAATDRAGRCVGGPRTQTLRRSGWLTSSRPASRPSPSSSPSRGRWVRGAQAETAATVGCDAWSGLFRAAWHRWQRRTCGARPRVMAARATAALLHAAARSRAIPVGTLQDPPPRATAASPQGRNEYPFHFRKPGDPRCSTQEKHFHTHHFVVNFQISTFPGILMTIGIVWGAFSVPEADS